MSAVMRGDARYRAPAHVHAARDLGHVDVRRFCHHAKIAGHGERCAAADAPALDRHDGDRVDLLPRLAHLRPRAQGDAAVAQALVVLPRAGGVLQVRPEGEVAGIAREDDGRNVRAGVESACRVGQLAERLDRQSIRLVAAIEAHGGDAACCFNRDESVCHLTCSPFRLEYGRASRGSPSRGVKGVPDPDVNHAWAWQSEWPFFPVPA